MNDDQIVRLIQTAIWAATVVVCVFCLAPALNLWVRRAFEHRESSSEGRQSQDPRHEPTRHNPPLVRRRHA